MTREIVVQDINIEIAKLAYHKKNMVAVKVMAEIIRLSSTCEVVPSDIDPAKFGISPQALRKAIYDLKKRGLITKKGSFIIPASECAPAETLILISKNT
jgi:hypothetical protein